MKIAPKPKQAREEGEQIGGGKVSEPYGTPESYPPQKEEKKWSEAGRACKKPSSLLKQTEARVL